MATVKLVYDGIPEAEKKRLRDAMIGQVGFPEPQKKGDPVYAFKKGWEHPNDVDRKKALRKVYMDKRTKEIDEDIALMDELKQVGGCSFARGVPVDVDLESFDVDAGNIAAKIKQGILRKVEAEKATASQLSDVTVLAESPAEKRGPGRPRKVTEETL